MKRGSIPDNPLDAVMALLHDVRTPLGNLENLLVMLRDDFGSCLTAEGVELLALALDESRALRHMLEGELINLCSSGRAAAELFDVDAMVRQIWDWMRGSKSISLVIPQRLPSIVGYKMEFRRIMLNLLSNAVKHCGNAEKVEITWSCTDRSTVFCVHDFGPGMPEAVLAMLARSDRGDTSEAVDLLPSTTGFGLGLLSTRRLVRRGEGEFRINSTPGSGTTICFSVPVLEETGAGMS